MTEPRTIALSAAMAYFREQLGECRVPGCNHSECH